MDRRHRTRGVFTPGPVAWEYQKNRNCNDPDWVVVSGPYASALLGVVETMDDVITPSFSRRVNKGEIIFNDMFWSKRDSILEVPGDGPTYKFTTGTPCTAVPSMKIEGKLTGPWCAFMLMDPAVLGPGHNFPIPFNELIPKEDIARMEVEATTRCLAERGKADNNLFESVAEYKETVRLLRNPTNSLFRFIKSNKPAIMRLSPEKAWLTYRYGIKPLISDITAIVNGLQKKIGNKRSTSRGSVDHGLASVSLLKKQFGIMEFTFNVQNVDNVSIRAMSLDEYVATTGSNIGFTTKGLLGVPWELVPYSFVADWFVNVGDYLNAYLPSPGYKQLGSCVTSRRTSATIYTVVKSAYIGSPIAMTGQASGSLSAIYSTKTRLKLGTPGLVIKSDFRFNTFTRSADALALLAVALESLFVKPRKLNLGPSRQAGRVISELRR